MSFLLDTNVCSAHMRRPAGLAHFFMQYTGRIAIPTIVLAELYAGAYCVDDPTRILAAIEDLCTDLRVLEFDESCALQFGKLRGELKRLGTPINAVDLLIAAVALRHDLTLVTHNTRDFERVPGLRLEDWFTP
jgi:tRNA(fMet)-specific endonuclease VapC